MSSCKNCVKNEYYDVACKKLHVDIKYRKCCALYERRPKGMKPKRLHHLEIVE